MRLLLVEANLQQKNAWQNRLQGEQTSIDTADSFQHAFEQIENADFDLILCPWFARDDMPVAAPQSTLRQFKSHARMLVCLLPQHDAELEAAAFAAGFDDCLPLDCSSERLVAKLQLAARLGQLQTRLQQAQKLESIGELAAGIAHEINTPIQYVGDNTRFVQDAWTDLSEVLGRCQTVLDALQSEGDLASAANELRQAMENADTEYLIEELPTAIQQTLEGVDRVTTIVRAMKEFAHPGGSEMTATDLTQSIANTVMVARNEWKYVAELETEFDPNLPPVPCLPGEINQVLLNIIVNAAHAIADAIGDAPESKRRINISTHHVPPFAQIRIADEGAGISPENLKRIFNPFFTTKAAGKGTGQGLAIAHAVVTEKHGGTIEVESELGRGTTFIIQLPLVQKTTPLALPGTGEAPIQETVLL